MFEEERENVKEEVKVKVNFILQLSMKAHKGEMGVEV